mgnify:FL=1
MSFGKRDYSKAYYVANKPRFIEYRKANSGKLARYSSDYYRKNQLRYADGQRFLKEARMRMGWSQAAVAADVGVSQVTISRLETGALPLETFRKRDKLLEVLGVEV